jgi:hypothetical protein
MGVRSGAEAPILPTYVEPRSADGTNWLLVFAAGSLKAGNTYNLALVPNSLQNANGIGIVMSGREYTYSFISSECSKHGTYRGGVCICDFGYAGNDCEHCAYGFYFDGVKCVQNGTALVPLSLARILSTPQSHAHMELTCALPSSSFPLTQRPLPTARRNRADAERATPEAYARSRWASAGTSITAPSSASVTHSSMLRATVVRRYDPSLGTRRDTFGLRNLAHTRTHTHTTVRAGLRRPPQVPEAQQVQPDLLQERHLVRRGEEQVHLSCQLGRPDLQRVRGRLQRSRVQGHHWQYASHNPVAIIIMLVSQRQLTRVFL